MLVMNQNTLPSQFLYYDDMNDTKTIANDDDAHSNKQQQLSS